MGFFNMDQAQDAYQQVYGGGQPPHLVTHELLAGAAGFEAMRLFEQYRERNGIPERHELIKELLAGFVTAELDKHFEKGLYGHLDREKARAAAQQQAYYLWQQRYGQQYGPQPGYGQPGPQGAPPGYPQQPQYGPQPGYGQPAPQYAPPPGYAPAPGYAGQPQGPPPDYRRMRPYGAPPQ